MAFKRMLHGDFAPSLLAKDGANDRAALFPHEMSRDMIGQTEEDDGVHDNLELGALGLARHERLGGLEKRGVHIHLGMVCGVET